MTNIMSKASRIEEIKSRVRLDNGVVVNGKTGRDIQGERMEYRDKIKNLQEKYHPQELQEMAKKGYLRKYEGR